MGKAKTTEQFKEEATATHGAEYDYSQVIYVNRITDVLITHRVCGKSFWQNPYSHATRGDKCPHCSKNGSSSIVHKEKIVIKD